MFAGVQITPLDVLEIVVLNFSEDTRENTETSCIEAVAQRCSVKQLFLEISPNSQENTCARVSFLNKVAD